MLVMVPLMYMTDEGVSYLEFVRSGLLSDEIDHVLGWDEAGDIVEDLVLRVDKSNCHVVHPEHLSVNQCVQFA